MLTIPTYIPININKLESFINKKYKIDICIDGEFIEEVLHDDYNYHIYKKGKKKNTLKIYKNRKDLKNKNNISLKELEFDNNNNNNKNSKLNVKPKVKSCIDDEIENISYKIKKIDIDSENKILDINSEYKNIVNQLNYINNNYEHLKNCYYYLIEKHKNTYNFFVSLTMGLQKIYNEIKTFKTNNNIIKIKEIEHKKVLYNIEKLIPKRELILNLNF